MDKIKIIFDTDIGDDIDDAFALALTLHSDEFELLGITTVFKNTELRAKIAKYMLQLANKKDIAVHTGVDKPLVNEIFRWKHETEEIDGKIKIRHYIDEMANAKTDGNNAVDFILDTIKKNPGEVVLVAIGPLTNIALCYQKDPDTFKQLKKIVMMGGSFLNSQYREWNIKVDPEAAEIVFNANVPMEIIGLDVTLKCNVETELVELLKRSTDPVNHVAYKMLEIWLKDNDRKATFHDPLAIATMISDCCEFEPTSIKVGIEDDNRARTFIIKKPDENSHLKIATSVDVSKFFNLIKERFNL